MTSCHYTKPQQMCADLLCSILILQLISTHALTNTKWQPLPHIHRRDLLISLPSLATTTLFSPLPSTATVTTSAPPLAPRSINSVQSHLSIPVWPSWAGGKVTPISTLQDPFLLLAHHDHWFDPRDPFREPFKSFGKATGLPYIDVEGFSMHPHRGFDILTYVLDGSDGFHHRDSLGGGEGIGHERVYRGGSAQWMRTGAGVLHEEYWETRDDRRTNIELFQLWVNLPSANKFDAPAVEYLGRDTDYGWVEEDIVDVATSSALMGSVRDVTATVDVATSSNPGVMARPPIRVLHVKINPGGEWFTAVPRFHTVTMYVRKGTALLPAISASGDDNMIPVVKSQQTANFASDGDSISIRNASSKKEGILDLLLLVGEPLKEPVAQYGPIVMNTVNELRDAYNQLEDGTFLDRNIALRQQALTSKYAGRG